MRRVLIPLLVVISIISCLACLNNNDDHVALDLEGGGIVPCWDNSYPDWETSEYVLPYPVGETYVVALSHCGGSYHGIGLPDQYAIDFNMSIGQTITASREGKVVFVEQSGEDGAFPNNRVVIEHEDGTYAQYMHLTINGALVAPGDTIQKGTEIGLSGNTGLAGYPHLHFVVTGTEGYEYPYESIPTTFKNTSANERSLISGNSYEAFAYED